MRRLLLGMPVCLLGFPLLVCLLRASSSLNKVQVNPDDPRPPANESGPLARAGQMDRLATEDPIAFLENCLRRYQGEVQGYQCILKKQERIDGALKPSEELEVFFREHPFSVYLRWLKGARLVSRALYVKGANGDKVLARPGFLNIVIEREVEGPDAKQSGRVTLNHFGIKEGTERTLKSWKAARDEGTLQVKYLGEKKVPEVGDLPCYVLQRQSKVPSQDGVMETTIFVDTENWLQVGSILKGKINSADGNREPIASYFFRDIKLNPELAADQFERAGLKK